MKANTENTNQLKRTHAKPYKVGKLYFGRRNTTRGAGWVVSRSADLSEPIESFEVGKQARAYCEEVRDGDKVITSSAEVSINIPAGSGLTDIFADVVEDKIV